MDLSRAERINSQRIPKDAATTWMDTIPAFSDFMLADSARKTPPLLVVAFRVSRINEPFLEKNFFKKYKLRRVRRGYM